MTFVKCKSAKFTKITSVYWWHLEKAWFSDPGIGHSDIRGLVTYRTMVRREPQHLFSWITCITASYTCANTVTSWMARTLKCSIASSRYLQVCNCCYSVYEAPYLLLDSEPRLCTQPHRQVPALDRVYNKCYTAFPNGKVMYLLLSSSPSVIIILHLLYALSRVAENWDSSDAMRCYWSSFPI